mmetsp:Transcript_27942/g.26786  ORF Transcript_27942/g.26786 Transcript_27942/m.26786 type:complete len:142 (-) Transcript_27942:57-482(-)
MKSKGLAGVFDHDFVDKSASVTKTLSVKEMEAQAKKIAERSAKTLQQSSRNQEHFTPTWTGCTETEPTRFGKSSRLPSTFPSQQKRKPTLKTGFDSSFGGSTTAGLGSASRGEALSSSVLLAKLKERNTQIEKNGNRRHNV